MAPQELRLDPTRQSGVLSSCSYPHNPLLKDCGVETGHNKKANPGRLAFLLNFIVKGFCLATFPLT